VCQAALWLVLEWDPKHPGGTALGPCWGYLQAAHYVPCRNHATRWELDNGTVLCSLHHGQYDRNEFDRAAFLRSRIGPERVERLHRLAAQPWDRDYQAVLASLTA
jgi:hypothetical protein